MGTEETPSVLVLELQSYDEALIKGDWGKTTELVLSIDAEKSAVSKIATPDAELTKTRDLIL